MNKSIAIFVLMAVVAFAVASATIGVGYRAGYYPYGGYHYGGPAYGRGYSFQAGVVPAYSSYQPYYQPYYGSYYGPSYYPYASRA